MEDSDQGSITVKKEPVKQELISLGAYFMVSL